MVLSWDITKRWGHGKVDYTTMEVVLDIYSRYVVGDDGHAGERQLAAEPAWRTAFRKQGWIPDTAHRPATAAPR